MKTWAKHWETQELLGFKNLLYRASLWSRVNRWLLQRNETQSECQPALVFLLYSQRLGLWYNFYYLIYQSSTAFIIQLLAVFSREWNQRLDLFIKVLSLLCPNLTDDSQAKDQPGLYSLCLAVTFIFCPTAQAFIRYSIQPSIENSWPKTVCSHGMSLSETWRRRPKDRL